MHLTTIFLLMNVFIFHFLFKLMQHEKKEDEPLRIRTDYVSGSDVL